jgi:hypothetical protein
MAGVEFGRRDQQSVRDSGYWRNQQLGALLFVKPAMKKSARHVRLYFLNSIFTLERNQVHPLSLLP